MRSRVINRLLPFLGLLLVIAIAIGIYYGYRKYPEKVELLQNYGYLGAFLVSLVLNATIILPAGNFLILFTLGAVLPSPTLVGLAGGLGAAIGEMTGYIAGYSGQAIVSRQKMYASIKRWVEKWGTLTIFVMAIVPIVFDLVGLAAGVVRFPLWKFFIACWLGRTILYLVIAWGGAMGWQFLLRFLS
jgi:membrane protein YqaA with SNARE-associated domain